MLSVGLLKLDRPQTTFLGEATQLDAKQLSNNLQLLSVDICRTIFMRSPIFLLSSSLLGYRN